MSKAHKKNKAEIIVVGKPVRNDVENFSTQMLCERHARIDSAVDGQNNHRLADDFPRDCAKRYKLLLRMEISRRMNRGDHEAVLYAKKREWAVTAEVPEFA